MEVSQPDPVAEWSSSGGETGLEVAMWQLGLGDGSETYPERPDEADCMYYLRTGFCGYGARCRFNHPRDRGLVAGAMRVNGSEYPERLGQSVCQYYMRTGMCKFGASCKYHHPRQLVASSSTVTLNISGYPLRPGENDCSYYVKTGQCKFGVTCKFHHPQPGGIIPSPAAAEPAPPGPMFSIPSAGHWQVARPHFLSGSYLPGPYGPGLIPPGMVQIPGWNLYQPPVGAGPVYAITQLSPSAPPFTGSYEELANPEWPGKPECQYYMKNGDCKFGSSCRYHHPPEWTLPNTIPHHPGAPLCSHYAQNGMCDFGPSCKFDHPMGTLTYSPSASSLADIPVTPYPIGPSIGTLAPSSSS